MNVSSVVDMNNISRSNKSHVEMDTNVSKLETSNTEVDVAEQIVNVDASKSQDSDQCDSTQNDRNIEGLHPLPGGKTLTHYNIMNIVMSDEPAMPSVPSGIKNNVYVVLDNRENMQNQKNGKPAKYWDDCGA